MENNTVDEEQVFNMIRQLLNFEQKDRMTMRKALTHPFLRE